MGYPAKIQRIRRKSSDQWYIGFPTAMAQGLDFQAGEVVEWTIIDRDQLLLRRHVPYPEKKYSNP